MTPRIRVGLAAAGLAALLVLVGGIALVDSYWHARHVATVYGADIPGWDMAPWRPLTTDGMLIAAFAVIWWRRLTDKHVPRLAWWAAGLAAVGTLAANAVAAQQSVGGWIVALWAPITLIVVDYLVALAIPPLVAAWRDARDADDEPIPYLPAEDTPTVELAAPVMSPPWPAPPDLTAWFSGTGPLWPDTTLGAPSDDWEARAAADGFIVPTRPVPDPDPDPDPDRVSAADDRRPHVDTIWTEDDERVRVQVQQMLDEGLLTAVPSGRWFRNNHGGMGSERAKRIIAQLRLPEGS